MLARNVEGKTGPSKESGRQEQGRRWASAGQDEGGGQSRGGSKARLPPTPRVAPGRATPSNAFLATAH